MGRFLRATFAFLALPGVVSFVAPPLLARVDPWRGVGQAWGLVPMSVGFVGLLLCVRDFFVVGRGTLAPWDPPRRMVRVGLYRFVRNPMYLANLTLVAGWALILGAPLLGLYAGALALMFHLRVLLHEERWLATTFPDDWAAFSAAVPRWCPRLGARFQALLTARDDGRRLRENPYSIGETSRCARPGNVPLESPGRPDDRLTP